MTVIRPRGTKDIFGQDLSRIREICEKIRNLFSAYGYSEIQTPMFENIEVFESNDETFLSSNKEFFEIKSRSKTKSEYVLRPENTASIVRAALENKIINKKVNYSVGLFYEGPYFRYERPQQGRFRQFIQMGIEKLNSNLIEDDVWNILMIQTLQNFFHLKLILRINYLGSESCKKNWNEKLRSYFKKYENELSEDSRSRLNGNAFRILDDKDDSKKGFIKNAPKLEDCFQEIDRLNIKKIKNLLSEFNVEYIWDEKLVRGIDYYTGLVYEWVDEKSGTTIIAGGRYDKLFERFKFHSVPSLGLAIGIDRLKMIMERDGLYEWKTGRKYLYLFPKEKASIKYLNWAQWIRQQIVNDCMDLVCIVSHSILDEDKHRKLSLKYTSTQDTVVILGWENKDLPEEERYEQFLEIKKKFSKNNISSV